MERKIIVGLFLLAILLGCLEKVPEVSQVETTTTEITLPARDFEIFLSLDKEVYHSNGEMNISVKVLSSEEVEDVLVRVKGIYSKRDRLSRKRLTDLKEGETLFYFSYTTPRCYGCAGISPGFYNITAELEYKGRVRANSTVLVEIRE